MLFRNSNLGYIKYVPAEIPRHTAIRLRLKDSAEHAISLYGVLESLIAVKSRQPSGAFHGKIDFSQPPWNAPVAHAITDLHSLSRKMERELRGELGLPERDRGGSDPNTRNALQSVLRLAESAEDFTVRLYAREIDKWIRRTHVSLGYDPLNPEHEVEIPKRLPRVPGNPEPKCPFCKNHTLREKPGMAEIFCINPACKDDKHRKPHAHMEYSEVAHDWVMVWQDGIAGVPA
jgi:hypothetical protein